MTKAETGKRNPLHEQNTPNFRLKSRKSFFYKMVKYLEKPPEEVPRKSWKPSVPKTTVNWRLKNEIHASRTRIRLDNLEIPQ